MTNVTEPGMTGTFRYDAYGDLTDTTYNDSTTGLVQSTVNAEDDQGRPVVTTDTDNGQSFTETDAYTSLGDLQSETFGSAGNTSVSYGYYGAGATAGSNGGDSDALASLTASTPGGQSVSQSYTYDSAGRLASITVNGITINYSYAPNSDQVETIGASPTGANLGDDFVNETYSPDSADGSRLSSISVGAGNSQSEGEVYDAGYGYNNDDQIASDQTTQTDSGGNTTSQSLNYTYDPNQADALTQVTDGSGNVLYNYGYDGTGDFTGNSTLGTANNVDEYSNLTYNARHDLTNDGTDAYGYDALDRLISITPDSPSSGSLSAQYGYDDQGRMLWENVYGYTGSNWGLYASYHYVWSGDELIEKLDADNNPLQQYTWGPGWDGEDQVIALTDYTQGSPTTYLLSYDASGNVTMLLNPAAGTVAASYSYTPYGALVSATGTAAGINPFLGKGDWTDAAVDPTLGFAQPDTADGTTRETEFALGIWLQDDPTGFNGGLNPTSADGNDPVNNVDPNGTRFESIKSAWNTISDIALFVSGNQAAVVADHAPQLQGAASSVGHAVVQAAISNAEHPQDFQVGQTLGVVNGAAKVVTGTLNAVGKAEAYSDTLLPQLSDSLNGAPDQNESAYAFFAVANHDAQALQVPDKLRQQGFNSAINGLASAGMDREALMSGASVGEFEFNTAMLAASFVDPELLFGDIADVGDLLDLSACSTGAAPGQINFITDSNDVFLRNISLRADIDPNGTLDIVAHGNQAQIQVGNKLVDAKQAASLIKQSGQFTGQDIRLLSCSTGASPTGFAQQLSDELGVTIGAPNDLIWAYTDGSTTIGPGQWVGGRLVPVYPHNGMFILFSPTNPKG